MSLLSRGIRSYILLVGVIVLIASLWTASTYLFEYSITEVGWPILTGIGVLVMGVVLGLRRLFRTAEPKKRTLIDYGWNNRK